MKTLLGMIVGVVLTLIVVTVTYFLKPSTQRDSAIVISIKNDTNYEINLITFKSNQGQFFSCSLVNKLCSIGLMNIGDSSFAVTAELTSGERLKSDIGYAEPGTNVELLMSEFIEEKI